MVSRPAERVVTLRPRGVLVAAGIVLGVVVAVELVVRARAGLTLIGIAGFLALALNPAVERFQRRGLSRGWAVCAVFAVAAAVVALAALVVVPPLVRQAGRLVDALPGIVADVTNGRGPLGFLETDYRVVERVRAATSGGPTLLRDATSALGVLRGAAVGVFGVVVIAFLALFMLLEGPHWRRRALALLPATSRPLVERVGAAVYRSVGGFVAGNLLASLLTGAVAALIMLVLGVPFAVPLGVLVGVGALVPYAGPVVGTLAVTAVASTRGGGTALTVLVLLTAYLVIEAHTIRPLLYGRAVSLSPLAVLVSILLCGEVAGILGALAAIPLAGTIGAVLRELAPEPPHA